ncbi:MAG: hypothetical protein IJV84_00340 [Bacteroidales bacterium]|nr:hypothetical protein [Bacteroidales bacterium]
MDIKAIETQLSANAKALEWGRVYLRGQELSEFRDKLIANRINLKRLKYASGFNPAAAIFGESQVGKSYMVDCLLTSDTQVLKVYDGHGNATGFIDSINPLGGGKEATSLISRFTIKPVWTDPDYPVRASMMTPIDVVILLVDSYFNDVINHDMPKPDMIRAEIESLKASYGNKSRKQSIITEDEIYELREYIKSGFVLRGEAFRMSLLECRYFEELSLLIDKIDIHEWTEVFSFLWNKQPIVTGIFSKLISTLQRMSFSSNVYIKIDAVLRDTGTILHVDRLHELFGLTEIVDEKGNKTIIQVASEPLMAVLTGDGVKLEGISKSEFCALATELAFTIVDTEKKTDSFLSEKPFLKESDILDFPGARSRQMINATTITEDDACKMILRGKIAYLFNKYSQQYLITNLLFCHHEQQSNVVTLSSLLQGWVQTTVGKTAESRAKFMQAVDVSPLFIIGTKFNIDLCKTIIEKGNLAEAQKDANKTYRWTKRFGILKNLINPTAENDWFTNWTPGIAFKNLYLLRSYDYSTEMFEGYKEQREGDPTWHIVRNPDGTIRGEIAVREEYKSFFSDLRRTFVEDSFVAAHFCNPETSWREVIGEESNTGWEAKDGSAYIIENLTKSSKRMSALRSEQYKSVSEEAFNELVKSLHEFYHDDNSDLELQKQARTAGTISLMFDVLFGKDKYFFSDFISSMLVDEEELHDVVMDIINNTKVVDDTDLSVLFAIRAKARIDNSLSFDENLDRLMNSYNCETQDQLVAVLKDYNVTVEEIINPPKMMNFSRLIADSVENMWVNTRLSLDRYQEFVKRGFKETELRKLLDNTTALYREKIKLSDRIAKKIHPFVSSSNAVDDMADMLADICAEMINRFVNTMGAAYYEEEMWDSVKSTIAKNRFDIDIPSDIQGDYVFDEFDAREKLPVVFDTFDNVDKILNEIPVDRNKLRHFSNYMEFYNWTELMKVSFLATQGIPKYDVNMNNALRNLFVNDIILQEVLKDLVDDSKILQSLSSLKSNENDRVN